MNVIVFNIKGEKKQGLLQAMGLLKEQRHCICAVGGGGKTTIIKALAFEFIKQRDKVLSLTTTKIKAPDYGILIKEESFALVEQASGIITVALPFKGEKLTGVSKEFQRQLLKEYPVVLIEADGSKGLPSKAPNETEPVIPEETTTVIAIQGIDALNRPIQEVCHRPEKVCELLGKSSDQLLTKEDMAELFLNERGLKKGVNGAEYWTIIQKVDTKERVKMAQSIASIMEKRGFHNILYTTSLDRIKAEKEENIKID